MCPLFRWPPVEYDLCVLASWLYLVVLLFAVWVAAAPACLAELATCASGTVVCLWTRVVWWWHLGAYHSGASSPLVLSLRGFGRVSWLARQYHSYGSALLRQARPLRPRASTNLVHPNVWGYMLCIQLCEWPLPWLSHQTIADLPTWLVVQPASRLVNICGGLLPNHGFVMFSNRVVPGSLDVLRLSGGFYISGQSSIWPLLLVLPRRPWTSQT